jgi:hypothetical protein
LSKRPFWFRFGVTYKWLDWLFGLRG